MAEDQQILAFATERLYRVFMSLEVMAGRASRLFARCFGHPPRWLVAAPGRVNLIGEHTDYNDGFVLPMAIERHVLIAADTNPGRQVTLHSVAKGETATFPVRPKVEQGEPDWSNYVRGVIAGFQALDKTVSAFDAVIESSLPFGGGLASSAALEVATATLLEAISGRTLDPLEKALLCQRAEHDFGGVPCGIMDQFTSILGQQNHALLLDCRSRTTTPVAMTAPEVTVLVINTNVRHRLAQGEYARRRARCEHAARALGVPALRDATPAALEAARTELEPVTFRRARHVISENERTLLAAQAIKAADWLKVGELMYASHTSLREDYEVSCPELDTVVDLAQRMGADGSVIGCRMTGAGFGGCVVGLVKTEAVPRITRSLDTAYEKKTGRQATIFPSRPAAGAAILQG